MTNLVGQVLLKRYRVESYVDSGSMGSVFRVWDLQRNAPLAMKVLHTEMADDPATFRRFQREANALKKLAHPNIVPFYGLYQTDDATFLLEAFIDGSTLKKVLQNTGGLFSTSQALAYLQPICAALGFAHANGVVHCDVKPGNVMVSTTGAVYLTDFGIARHADSSTTTLAGAGSPAYMPPEQIRGEELSPAADVYALGVMLFEFLTGERPFLGSEAQAERAGPTTAERVRYAHLNLPAPDPRSLNPQISPALAQVILRALEKDPLRRYPNAPVFYEAVQAATGLPAEAILHSPLQTVAPPQPKGPVAGSGSAGQGRKTLIGLLGAAALVGVLGFALLGLSRNNGGPPEQSVQGTASVIFQPVGVAANTWAASITDPPASSAVTVPPAAASLALTNSPGLQITSTPTAAIEDPRTPPACTAVGEIWASPIDGMRLVCVPAGEFFHNPENNAIHLEAFWADQTEVTNAMYAGCVQAGECSPPRAGQSNEPIDYYGQSGGGSFPVTRLSWGQASQYCAWAGRRLLTDLEWQKTARGTDQRIYPWGDAFVDCQHANISGCANSYNVVGSYPNGASPLGALDMIGNVYEWVDAACAQGQVAMGGSWYDSPEKAVVYEAACRTADSQSSKLGFRCGY